MSQFSVPNSQFSNPQSPISHLNSHIYIGLGTNMGERELNLQNAIEHIEKKVGKVLAQSSIYETPAWGLTDQPDFLNQVIEIETSQTPPQILENILQIEIEMGRIREKKWGPRLIDLDILFYNNLIFNTENLQIPHPYIHQRAFVLEPLNEIAPNFVHPVFEKTISELVGLTLTNRTAEAVLNFVKVATHNKFTKKL